MVPFRHVYLGKSPLRKFMRHVTGHGRITLWVSMQTKVGELTLEEPQVVGQAYLASFGGEGGLSPPFLLDAEVQVFWN